MAIEPWLNVLGWKAIPNFITIHDLPSSEKFLKLYHRNDPHLTAFFVDLQEGLKGEYPDPAVRIESPPGWGKTSCFYFLRASKDLRKKFYHVVIHANRFIGAHGLDREATFNECFEATYGFLNECAPDHNFAKDVVANGGLTNQQKLSKFLKYITDNRTKFRERLAVIIDDVDVIQNEKDILGAVLDVFQNLQPMAIIKWLAIRNVTYENYSQDTKEQLDTLFPLVYNFPNVALSEIFKVRLSEVKSENSINPFSDRLCDVIQRLYNGDHRQGLATLKELLQTIPPGDMAEKATEAFVQRYIERMSISILLKRQAIPNIFLIYGNVNTLLPIPMEILQLANYRRIINDEFVALIEESLASKYKQITGKKYMATINRSIVLDAAKYLHRMGLIALRNDEEIHIMTRGRFTQRYLSQQYYIQLCKKELADEHTDETFWKIAEATSPYHKILFEELFQEKEEQDP